MSDWKDWDKLLPGKKVNQVADRPSPMLLDAKVQL